MAKEDFVLDVRRALGAVSPKVEADSEQLHTGQIAAVLTRVALWLTPKTVEAFDPDDFAESPHREALVAAVEDFRRLASQVETEATDEQFQHGVDLFNRLSRILSQDVLEGWRVAVNGIVSDAKAWASKHGLSCRVETKHLNEKLLGDYELQQVFLQVEASTLLLSPVARFVPGAIGMVDLSIIPSYHVVMIPRTLDGWQIHLEGSSAATSVQRLAWEEENFLKAIEWLRNRE